VTGSRDGLRAAVRNRLGAGDGDPMEGLRSAPDQCGDAVGSIRPVEVVGPADWIPDRAEQPGPQWSGRTSEPGADRATHHIIR
jgi:hypothetical protein